jgi:hypothetical protein
MSYKPLIYKLYYQMDNKLTEQDIKTLHEAATLSNIRYYINIWFGDHRHIYKETIQSFESCLKRASDRSIAINLSTLQYKYQAIDHIKEIKIRDYKLIDEWLNEYKKVNHILNIQ